MQMRQEHFRWRFVAEAFPRLVVEMAGKVDQVALRDGCEISIACEFIGMSHLEIECTRLQCQS
ncbi:hypothetical protein GCM10010520_57610 [Rhizobium viscosum]